MLTATLQRSAHHLLRVIGRAVVDVDTWQLEVAIATDMVIELPRQCRHEIRSGSSQAIPELCATLTDPCEIVVWSKPRTVLHS